MPILIDHLTHTYLAGTAQAHNALFDLSLTIEEGEFIGLLGHTGSGKTTLIQHLNGLMKPTSGKVVVDGEELWAKGTQLKSIRQKIGMAFQYPEYQLFEETVAKDVAFGPKNLGLGKDEMDRRVRDAIARVGLNYEDVAERSPFELSGGQMRRVAIAGVLAMEPKYLILDEPTAGLDPAGRRDILSMVQSLHAAGGLTVIMVSHSMDDIARLATRLVVLSRGELRMTGTPREIFRREEELSAIGLDIPQAAKLAHALRRAGVQVPEDLYTLEEAEQALLALGREAGLC